MEGKKKNNFCLSRKKYLYIHICKSERIFDYRPTRSSNQAGTNRRGKKEEVK